MLALAVLTLIVGSVATFIAARQYYLSKQTAPSPATQIIYYSGELPNGYKGSIPATYCTSAENSERDGSYRCDDGNSVLDPCFTQENNEFSRVLACPLNPITGAVQFVRDTQPVVSQGFTENPARGNPWAMELANGSICLYAPDGASEEDGMHQNWYCTKHLGKRIPESAITGYALGAVQRPSATWYAYFAAPQGDEATEIRVQKVWF